MKRLISLASALLLVTFLCGCSSQNGNGRRHHNHNAKKKQSTSEQSCKSCGKPAPQNKKSS